MAVIISGLIIYSYTSVNSTRIMSTKLQDKELELDQSKIKVIELQQQITELQLDTDNLEKFNNFYSKALMEHTLAYYDESGADYNYDLYGWYYKQGYFSDSVEYCVAARDLFISSNSHHQKAKSYFEEADKIAKEKYNELIDNYIKLHTISIDINWAMYEACEYFESASSKYAQGYYDSGDSELKIGNEKIRKHDSLITQHNTYLSKIEVLEEGI